MPETITLQPGDTVKSGGNRYRLAEDATASVDLVPETAKSQPQQKFSIACVTPSCVARQKEVLSGRRGRPSPHGPRLIFTGTYSTGEQMIAAGEFALPNCATCNAPYQWLDVPVKDANREAEEIAEANRIADELMSTEVDAI